MDKIQSIIHEVKKVIIGKDEVIKKVLTAILANGHILLEDVPGVGKTSLAISFSKAMSLKHKRLQFTPDVLPSDVTGFSMYNKKTNSFEYCEGAAICNLMLADEINRTSPKTQSALLEVMEEGKVTVDGVTHELPKPFNVIATQNPLGFAGTQILPESQLDRFIIKISMGYPDKESEINILKGKTSMDTYDAVRSVVSSEEITELQVQVKKVHVDDTLFEYITELVTKTRNDPSIQLGISIRGSVALLNMAKSTAFIDGRDYIIPEDIQSVFADVAAHRVALTSKAKFKGISAHEIITEIMESTGLVKIG